MIPLIGAAWALETPPSAAEPRRPAKAAFLIEIIILLPFV
jgi:hypothetical protein